MDEASITALLHSPAWPHRGEAVELIETHISWVLLADQLAYKIKKPLNFGFLDFSTLEKRRYCCEEEVRLNRRLAPTLYRDVVAITESGGELGLSGQGAVVDYAVRMSRFDTRQGFDQLLAQGELGHREMDQTARVLARFHADAASAAVDSGFGKPDAVALPILENFAQISPNFDAQLPESGQRSRFDLLEAWSRAACERFRAVLDERLLAGFVRECHGDLHLRNIVIWEGQVTPFDCIEFSPALRWIDIVSELAFLLMDLDDHARPDLSARLLNVYLEYSGDYEGLALLRFYQVYRAMVRAKVESLRLAQLAVVDAGMRDAMARYLSLAESYTRPGTPVLVVAHGLSGAGKTTVSDRLLDHCTFIRLRSDVERKRLYGFSPLENSGSPRDGGIYSLEANTRTYQRLADLAAECLAQGFSVLVDAAFLKREERELFRSLAERLAVPFATLHCFADPGVQRARVIARGDAGGDASEADVTVLEQQLRFQEPLEEDELATVIPVDTTARPDLSRLVAFMLQSGKGD